MKTGLSVKIRDAFEKFHLDTDFSTPAKGITALFGPSGSGKTSILRSIAGLRKSPDTEISFNNQVWQDQTAFVPPHKRPLAYVFQEPSLFAHLSVKQNLLFGFKRIPDSQRRITLDSITELLGLEKLLQRSSTSLSGGEQQRVAIGRALLTSPELLLMDEPLSALDITARQSILPRLEALRNELAIPILYVSHDTGEVARLADNLVLLESGRVIAQGKAADLLSRLDLPLSLFDDATCLVEGTVSGHDLHDHLTCIHTGGGNFALPRENIPAGQSVRIEIRARDVSLALTAHTDTSIINILPVTLIDMQDINPAQILVRLQLEDRQILLARITRRSAQKLDLQKQMKLFAQIKSVALVT